MMKFFEIIKANKDIRNNLSGPEYNIFILSNIITQQLNPILEYQLRLNGVNANVKSGDYDNILQDSQRSKDFNAVFIFWELANILDGFQYRANLLDNTETEKILTRFKNEIDRVFQNLSTNSLVIFNKFSSIVFNNHYLRNNNFDYVCDELNRYLDEKKNLNTVIVEIDKVIARLCIDRSVDFRNYYSSKALYTVDFYKEYVSFVIPVIYSLLGKAKKALIFDCDNTLWNGIIGEDTIEGIAMSASTPKGVVFEEVQFLAKELASKGVILGLNSKNNPEDVDEVLSSHKDLSLLPGEITIKQVNWNDKVTNLTLVAEELNIGIDSLVFVDDSDFEINLVKDMLPQVQTVQVPKELYNYPCRFRSYMSLFYNLNETAEDKTRAAMYAHEAERNSVKSSFTNFEDYLESLDLQIVVYRNPVELIPRLAQLTQKTNQFNLTTKRYSEVQLTALVNDKEYEVFAFEVNDKFGSFGITGEMFLEIKKPNAHIDTFLMSCRVLGRNIEQKFMQTVLNHLKNSGVELVTASYSKTFKNDQVKDFYEKLGFELINDTGEVKSYKLYLNNYNSKPIDYISVTHE